MADAQPPPEAGSELTSLGHANEQIQHNANSNEFNTTVTMATTSVASEAMTENKDETNNSYIQSAKSRIAGLSLRNQRLIDSMRIRAVTKSISESDDDVDRLYSPGGPISPAKSPRSPKKPEFRSNAPPTPPLPFEGSTPKRKARHNSPATSISAISTLSSPTRRSRRNEHIEYKVPPAADSNSADGTTRSRSRARTSPAKIVYGDRSEENSGSSSPGRMQIRQREEPAGHVKTIVSAFESKGTTPINGNVSESDRPLLRIGSRVDGESNRFLIASPRFMEGQSPTSTSSDSPKQFQAPEMEPISGTINTLEKDITPRASTSIVDREEMDDRNEGPFWAEMKRLRMQLQRLEVQGMQRQESIDSASPKEKHIVKVMTSPHRKTRSVNYTYLLGGTTISQDRLYSRRAVSPLPMSSSTSSQVHDMETKHKMTMKRNAENERTPSRAVTDTPASVLDYKYELHPRYSGFSPSQRITPSKTQSALTLPLPAASLVSSSTSRSRHRSTAVHQRLMQDAFDVFEKSVLESSTVEIERGNSSSRKSPKGSLIHTMASVVSCALSMNQHLRQMSAANISDEDEEISPIEATHTFSRTISLLLKSSDEQVRSLTETMLTLGSVLQDDESVNSITTMGRPSSSSSRQRSRNNVSVEFEDHSNHSNYPNHPNHPNHYVLTSPSPYRNSKSAPSSTIISSAKKFITRVASPTEYDNNNQEEEIYHGKEEDLQATLRAGSGQSRSFITTGRASVMGIGIEAVPPVPQIPSVHHDQRRRSIINLNGRRSVASYSSPSSTPTGVSSRKFMTPARDQDRDRDGDGEDDQLKDRKRNRPQDQELDQINESGHIYGNRNRDMEYESPRSASSLLSKPGSSTLPRSWRSRQNRASVIPEIRRELTPTKNDLKDNIREISSSPIPVRQGGLSRVKKRSLVGGLTRAGGVRNLYMDEFGRIEKHRSDTSGDSGGNGFHRSNSDGSFAG